MLWAIITGPSNNEALCFNVAEALLSFHVHKEFFLTAGEGAGEAGRPCTRIH